MFSSSLHDQFAHHTVAGVKDVVEPLPQQFLGLRNAPGYYRVKFLIDTERDDLSSNVSRFFNPIDKNNSLSSCVFTIKAWFSNKEWHIHLTKTQFMLLIHTPLVISSNDSNYCTNTWSKPNNTCVTMPTHQMSGSFSC